MDNLNFRAKADLVKAIAKQYRIAKLEGRLAMSNNDGFEESKMVEFVNHVLHELDIESKRIIVNDYFEIQSCGWYLDYYQRSTYYKLKKQALNDFLRCLDI